MFDWITVENAQIILKFIVNATSLSLSILISQYNKIHKIS